VGRNGNVLSEVKRRKEGNKLLRRRVIKVIDMKVEVASYKKFMRSSGSRGEEVLEVFKEYRKFLRVRRGRRATIYIEDCELRRRQFQGE
jgi:hypothetical protein